MGKWISYSKEELAYLKQRKKMARKKLYLKFNAKFKRDVSCNNIKNLMLRKGWLTGRTGCFEKGHIPSPLSFPKGPNRTSFKKGNVPGNLKPLWTERITKDGYIEIKVAEKNPYTPAKTRYRLAHIWMWEQTHGKILKGFCVSLIDGDKLNCEPDNLELISRNENCRRNQLRYWEQPEEMKPTVKAIAKLQAQIGDRNRGAYENVATDGMSIRGCG